MNGLLLVVIKLVALWKVEVGIIFLCNKVAILVVMKVVTIKT